MLVLVAEVEMQLEMEEVVTVDQVETARMAILLTVRMYYNFSV